MSGLNLELRGVMFAGGSVGYQCRYAIQEDTDRYPTGATIDIFLVPLGRNKSQLLLC